MKCVWFNAWGQDGRETNVFEDDNLGFISRLAKSIGVSPVSRGVLSRIRQLKTPRGCHNFYVAVQSGPPFVKRGSVYLFTFF